jgi:hypothetical protein
MSSKTEKQDWTLDQLAKSEFFHRKLHEWQLLEIARRIETVQGENLVWARERLSISENAWNKVIHRGIKPVIVFAHPQVLIDIPRSLGYYRMLAMVSQKSMKRIGLDTERYENGREITSDNAARRFATHLNKLICLLVEADTTIDVREFDLWRGMAAGSQAQGSWQNTKGDRIEGLVKGVLQRRVRATEQVVSESENGQRISLKNQRELVFASEPDVAIYDSSGQIVAAVEIKGGIDTAGILERIGAAIKSLSRIKEENPVATTVLLIPAVAMTPQATSLLETSRNVIDHWFAVEDILEHEKRHEAFLSLLDL